MQLVKTETPSSRPQLIASLEERIEGLQAIAHFVPEWTPNEQLKVGRQAVILQAKKLTTLLTSIISETEMEEIVEPESLPVDLGSSIRGLKSLRRHLSASANPRIKIGLKEITEHIKDLEATLEAA